MHVNEETAQQISRLVDQLVIEERMASVFSYRGKRNLYRYWRNRACRTQISLADQYGIVLDYDNQAREILGQTRSKSA